MRENLAPLLNKRITVHGTFVEYRTFTRGGYGVDRALFVDITGSAGEELTDHVWVLKGKQIEKLNLEPGDRLKFTGTVCVYWKGYHDDRRPDYRLSRQRDFVRLAKSVPIGDDVDQLQRDFLASLNP